MGSLFTNDYHRNVRVMVEREMAHEKEWIKLSSQQTLFTRAEIIIMFARTLLVSSTLSFLFILSFSYKHVQLFSAWHSFSSVSNNKLKCLNYLFTPALSSYDLITLNNSCQSGGKLKGNGWGIWYCHFGYRLEGMHGICLYFYSTIFIRNAS